VYLSLNFTHPLTDVVSKFSKYIRNKNCKDLSVGKDLTKFTKIFTPEFFIFVLYIYIFIKKNEYFENFDMI
jgi:preprotein translocase subunit SecG